MSHSPPKTLGGNPTTDPINNLKSKKGRNSRKNKPKQTCILRQFTIMHPSKIIKIKKQALEEGKKNLTMLYEREQEE